MVIQLVPAPDAAPETFHVTAQQLETVRRYLTPPAVFAFQVWPTTDRTITQRFGERPEYYKNYGFPGHEGVDVRAPLGSPIVAVAAGTVTAVTNKRMDGRESAYGWYVRISHAGGYATWYAHLAEWPPVHVEQAVAAGDIIGYSGNTGRSSGPHLHLSLTGPGSSWRTGHIDPLPYLEAIP